ncbi:MAG TPA: hypothetical protein VH331_17760 [Allosphingosinicella sp.]|nr:hypothetical protein [Allosphingosinicella sp.]
MALSRILPTFAACLLLAGPAICASPAPVEVVTAAKLRADVAITSNGLATHPVTLDPASRTIVARRDGPGEVEVHAVLNDVAIVQAGSATLIAGGRVEGGRETGPNEHRGGTIVGGQSHILRAGDVAWIPAGTPHQLIVPKGGSFTYVVVKTDKAATAP